MQWPAQVVEPDYAQHEHVIPQIAEMFNGSSKHPAAMISNFLQSYTSPTFSEAAFETPRKVSNYAYCGNMHIVGACAMRLQHVQPNIGRNNQTYII